MPDRCVQWDVQLYCPHATIRASLNDEEAKGAGRLYHEKAAGKGLAAALPGANSPGLHGLRQLRRYLPGERKATMQHAEQEIARKLQTEYAMTIAAKDDLVDPRTVKSSQFVRPPGI